MRTDKPKRILQIENLFYDLIVRHELRFDGELIHGDIYKWTLGHKSTIIFNDEGVDYLIAGYVSSTVYDEMEEGLRDLGFNIIDTDGSRMILEETWHKGDFPFFILGCFLLDI